MVYTICEMLAFIWRKITIAIAKTCIYNQSIRFQFTIVDRIIKITYILELSLNKTLKIFNDLLGKYKKVQNKFSFLII